MRTDDEILTIIENYLSEPMETLFCDLPVEERKEAFLRLIYEWLESNYGV